MDADVKVAGLAELDAQLAALPEAVGVRVMNQTLLFAAKPVRDVAQSNARLIGRSGAMAQTIQARSVKRTGDPTIFEAVVGFRKKNANAAALANLYYGRKKKVKGAYWGGFNEKGTAKMGARPMLVPAWMQERGRMPQIIAEQLRVSIARAVKKLSRKK